MEPHVGVDVRRPDDRYETVDAVLDTGFNGFLTLPQSLVQQLRLEPLGQGLAILADGSEVVSAVYAAVVRWDREEREIEVDAADGAVLLGMSLLEGYDLFLRARDDGRIALQRIPDTEE